MDHSNGGLHIVMLPWLALGHILPFLDLSKRIAGKGHRVSFLCTPRNIKRLPKIPPSLAPMINLVELHLPHVHNLPENAEATIDLPSQELRPYLRMAYDALAEQVSRFLRDASPDWILYDYSPYWVPRVAAESGGVPCAYLGLFSAAVFAFFGTPTALMSGEGSRTEPEQFTVPPKWVTFPSTIAYRPHEARELLRPGLAPDASGVSESHRFGAAIEGCQFVAIRSCTEVEHDWLRLLGELYRKPIVPVGLLPPSIDDGVDKDESDVESRERWKGTFDWLDKQEPGSVVYAAFGSEVKLSCAQVHEIATGLEKSELPFVWALRRPFDESDDRNMLPEGFEDRISDRGIVCLGWVPQVRILAHSSAGGFLTHCGWNSVVEGLSFGLAIVLLPLMFDQGLNSRNLVEREIGMEVPRDEEDGSFAGDEIAKTLRLVMVDEEGKPFRTRARESRALFGNEELHDRYVSDFVKYLMDNKRQQ